MGIRLNKVLSELNIGLQTAVDFLKKKSLGEIEDDAKLSTKISDEQYEALVTEFKGDQAMKHEAEKIFIKKAKEKKQEKEEKRTTKAEELLEQRQQFKPMGKIDLDALSGKKATPAAPKQEPVEEKPEVVAVEPEPIVEEKPVEQEPEPVVVEKEEPQPVIEEQIPEPVAEETPVAQPVEQPVVEETLPSQGTTEIYTLKSEEKMVPKVNVLGKIDLSTINQSTRPKKKSKEERRKEREEKAAQNGERKKRERIRSGKERVDIESAGIQANGNNGGKKGKNKGGNQPSADNQGGGKKNKKNRPVQKSLEVDEEAVARQVKETLARLTSKSQNKKGAKYRREKRDAVQERLNEEMAEQAAESKVLKLTEFVTVSELATMMNVPVNKVIGTCMTIGIMVSINQRLDAETINLVADEFGFSTEYVSAEVQNAIQEEEDDENDLIPRAPIVTVMGHVDHGKTSLLDYIRNTNVIAGEAGGITQHIGAYNVSLKDGRQITFLDTPGHEAFTAMRARGTQVTDIAIIIIAADDSVMPTTKEAIAHAQAANVPMVFAINKIDKPGANPDKIREDLAQMNLLVEEWGGKYQCQEISAKKGIGVEELLEKVLLEAEMLDLKANPNRKATGSIIESSLDKGRGYVSTVLVSNGTLNIGDVVIAGTSHGRIKAMFNERNQRIQQAKPAEPAIILGLNGAPTAGDSFHVMETEQEAREIANKREQLQREQGLRTQKTLGLDDIS
ncbi:MAG: translation initiation factor IF-2, partial [Prevotella sp.]|nr:translation initiation factor IF-2 [Prevotella sp.]